VAGAAEEELDDELPPDEAAETVTVKEVVVD
jgi:hypothetical protein